MAWHCWGPCPAPPRQTENLAGVADQADQAAPTRMARGGTRCRPLPLPMTALAGPGWPCELAKATGAECALRRTRAFYHPLGPTTPYPA